MHANGSGTRVGIAGMHEACPRPFQRAREISGPGESSAPVAAATRRQQPVRRGGNTRSQNAVELPQESG